MLRVIGVALTFAGGAGTAVTNNSGSDNLAAIAAMITALSGVVATIGGLWLARQSRARLEDQLAQAEAERTLLVDVMLRNTALERERDVDSDHEA